MAASEEIISVPDMSGDERIRVFRRSFQSIEGFDGIEVDAYVIITSRYVIFCDTLFCPEDMAVLQHEVRHELANRQLLVINSHADWDHAWGNGYFPAGTPIISHDQARARLLSDRARETLAYYQQRSPLFQTVTLTPPTLTFSQKLTLFGGDLTLELFAAPGHKPDHIAIWLPELRLLLAFDAVESPFPTLESAHSVQSMFQTLEHFLTLQPERVLCAHGNTTDVAAVKNNLAYLHEIANRCRTFLHTHPQSLTSEELEQASTLINYPFDEVIAGSQQHIDRSFYPGVHNHNVSCIMQWCMS